MVTHDILTAMQGEGRWVSSKIISAADFAW
jgi:hypothetical protein